MSSRSALDLSTRTVKIYSGAADAQARADIAEHLADNENPHEVTAEQVGLGFADNTSDADKPVSGPQAAALALKAPLASPALSGVPTAPTAAPGTVGDQVATTGFVQAALTAVDVPGLTADLAAHLDDLANPHQVSKAQVGLALADNTADTSKPVSGPQQAAINAAAAIGTAAQADIDGHQANVNNPHNTTKSQVGLGAVDNTSDIAKPVSTATAAALALKAPLASPALTGVPTAPTAAPGTNTTQLATTGFTKAAVDASAATLTAALALKAPLASPALTGVPTAPTAAPGTSSVQLATTAFADAIGDALTASLGAHTANVSNPHTVTKAQVGLGNADNTSDLAKPVSTATQTALNLKAPLANPALTGTPTAPTAAIGTSSTQIATTAFADAIGDTLTASLTAHAGNVSNPHGVTKAQVGLALADNTSDANKPVSTATQTALNLKAPLASPALTGTPTAPTAAAGTSTTQIATTAFADAIGDALTASLTAHTASVSNPHATTKAQIGLGNADNTSDLNKPVSTAQQAAINSAVAPKANIASPALTGVPTAPTAAPGTSTTQIATTAFADAIGDSLRAALDGMASAASRPGDAVALYGTLATGTAAAMPRVDPTWVATSAAGNVVRVNSATADDPQVIAPAAAFTVGPVSHVTWQVQRQTDPIDPLNDSVTLAIRWLTNTYAGVAGAAGISTIANLPLVIANGIVTRTARIGGGGLVPPAGAVYFRPYVQLFGNNHITDVIVLDTEDTEIAVAYANTRADLAALDTNQSTVAYLTEAQRDGMFVWDATVPMATHTADTRQGSYVAPNPAANGAWVREPVTMTNVMHYGAVMDGTTSDLAALTAAYNATPALGVLYVPGGHINAGGFAPTSKFMLLKADGVYESTGTVPLIGLGIVTLETFIQAGTKYFGKFTKGAPDFGPTLRVDQTMNHTGGPSGGNVALQANMTVASDFAGSFVGIAIAAEATDNRNTPSLPETIGLLCQAVRNNPGVGATIFGANPIADDRSMVPSSQAGSSVGMEISVKANKLDDGFLADGFNINDAASGSVEGANRIGLDIKYTHSNYGDGSPVDWSNFLNIGPSNPLEPNLSGKNFIRLNGIATYSGINMRHLVVNTGRAVVMMSGQSVAWTPNLSNELPTHWNYLEHQVTGGSRFRFVHDSQELFSVSDAGRLGLGVLPTNAADDVAAAGAGVPVGGIYRTGSALKVRVA